MNTSTSTDLGMSGEHDRVLAANKAALEEPLLSSLFVRGDFATRKTTIAHTGYYGLSRSRAGGRLVWTTSWIALQFSAHQHINHTSGSAKYTNKQPKRMAIVLRRSGTLASKWTHASTSISSACARSAARAFASSSTNSTGDAAVLQSWLGTSSRRQVDVSAFEALQVEYLSTNKHILSIRLNRPSKFNAMNMQVWHKMEQVFDQIEQDPSIRAVIVSGNGKCFSSGMDLNVFATMQQLAQHETCEARKREQLAQLIARFQRVILAPEQCRVPVLASVHSLCIGAGVDFVSACDLRFCDTSAQFSIKEIDLAIVADVGTLQRVPKLIGEQQTKELAYTGRIFSGLEAEKNGFVLKCLADKHQLDQQVLDVAFQIARKSPLTIRGIKKTIHYQRDHTTEDALQQVKALNASSLMSEDLVAAITAHTSKSNAVFRED